MADVRNKPSIPIVADFISGDGRGTDIICDTTSGIAYFLNGSNIVTPIGANYAYSDEQAQDAVGAAIAAGAQSGITVTYTDASNKIDFTVTPTTADVRNHIINGSLDIWQRGTSFTNSTTTSNFYTADRWGFNRAGDTLGTQISRQISGLPGSRYYLLWQRTPGDTATGAYACWYALETADSQPLAGKTVTLSIWAFKGATYSGGVLSMILAYGTGTDQRYYSMTGATLVAATNATLTTGWVRYSCTGTIPSNATEVGFSLAWTPSGTAGATDYVGIAEAQLELGSTPTTFAPRPFSLELLLCQRYYEKTFNYSITPASALGLQTPGTVISVASGTTVLICWLYKVNKRTAATISTYNPALANVNWRNTANTADTVFSLGANGENGCLLQAGAATDINGYQINAVADADL